LHRLGAGLKPDLNRGRIATTLAMLRRNGTTLIRTQASPIVDARLVRDVAVLRALAQLERR
jgi:hypothetical protein